MPTLEAILGLLPVRLLVCVCAPVWRVHYLRIAGSKRPIEEVVSQGAPDYMSLAGLLSSNKDKPEPPPPPVSVAVEECRIFRQRTRTPSCRL